MCRNEGLKHSSNDWIIFWDADDIPILDGLFAMLEFAQQENKDIVVGQAIRVDENLNEHLIKSSWFGLITWPGIWRILFNRRLIRNKEFATWKWCEDQDFILKTFPYSLELGWFDQVTYKYNQNVLGSTTKDQQNSIFLNRFYEKLKNPNSYQTNAALVRLFEVKTLLTLFRRNPKSWVIPLMIATFDSLISSLINLSKLRR